MPQKTIPETVRDYLAGRNAPAQQLLTSLESRYHEPWRHYHVLKHPLALFDILLAHETQIKNPRVLGWTVMYHDAIYDPLSAAGRNEELSAQLAEAELTPLLGAKEAGLVAAYTRATASHGTAEQDPDLDFFLDADLAILGAPAEAYDEYAANIRKEYAHVPDDAYLLGRAAILTSLSTRVQESGLYTTELFKHAYERQAIGNIGHEISLLQATSEH